MKPINLQWAVALLLISVVRLCAGPVLIDNFNDDTIDPSKWNIVLREPGASVTETGGSAHLHNRGTLVSVDDFTRIDLVGRFRFVGSNHDRFVVFTRSDGLATNHFNDMDNGIVFRFQQDIGQIAIDDWDYYNATNPVLATASFGFANGTWYDFRIVDDGYNVSLYFNDLTNPLITAATTSRHGGKLALNNNWNNNAVELDFVRARGVPDSLHSAATLVAVAIAFAGLVTRRASRFGVSLSRPLKSAD